MRIPILFILLLPLTLLAAKEDFSANGIPDSLLKRAHSVVRFAETDIKVNAPGKAEYTCHKKITVLDEAGATELKIALFYNKFSTITSFKASLYNKDGKLMNKRTESDMQDNAAFDGFSLFNDARVKHIQTNGGLYPITIDYTYTVRYSGILSYPGLRIQEDGQSVQFAKFNLEMPPGIDIKYNARNIDLSPTTSAQKNGGINYSWQIENLSAIKVPVNSYEEKYFLPQLELSPGTFEIGGYQGSFKTWKDFGLTMNKMWTDTRDLPPAVVAEVEAMVKGVRTDREKAEVIYNYLQHNFRYVSVQIGIGGWIPFKASDVHATKYGDCKALSNYMCSMLKAVGIKAYPALINAGRNAHAIDTVFPGNYFNHAILYAPLNDGPLWLECTSNALPCGELGTFTENRYALIFDDEGGRIVNTPVANADINALKMVSTIDVDSIMQARISNLTMLRGEFRSAARYDLLLGNTKDRSDYIFNMITLRQPENYALNNIVDTLGSISFKMEGEYDKIYDFKTGGKAFLPSTAAKSWYENVTADPQSLHDLILGFPSAKTELLTYNLSAKTGKVNLPGNYTIDNDLIYFKRKAEQNEGTVTIQTELTLKKHIIAPHEISQLKENLQTVNKYLQQKLIIDQK